MKFNKIVLSRTDSIGDVVLTLPLAGWLKREYPDVQITFLGSDYTRDVVEACVYVDEFVAWPFSAGQHTSRQSFESGPHFNPKNTGLKKILEADLFVHVFPRKEIARFAKKAGIPQRLGTSHRIYHWFTCNRLVSFSRKRSDLHEAQLNFRLLTGITRKTVPGLNEIGSLYGLEKILPLQKEIADLIDRKRFNLILHPSSKGSAREWGRNNFSELIKLLPQDEFRIFITGTEQEGEELRKGGFFYEGKR